MSRSLILVFVVLTIINLFLMVSSTGIDVIGSGLNTIGSSTQTILTGLMNSIQSEVVALKSLPEIEQATTLLNGLVANVDDLLADLQSTATNLLKEALHNILDAVDIIESVTLKSSSLLNALIETLGDLLQQVHTSVTQLVSLDANLLGSLTDKVARSTNNVLIEVQKLDEIVVGTLGRALTTQLININNAVGSILNFFQSNILSKVSNLTKETLIKVISFMSQLLQVDHLIGAIVQRIVAHLFTLISQIIGALQGIVTPVVGTLTTTLNQLTTCLSCFTDNSGLIGRRRRRALL